MTASETDHAITSRRSVRAFMPTPVPRPVIEAILDAAACAPSGTNMQPWRGHVLIGVEKDALCDAVCAALDETDPANRRAVKYSPTSSSSLTYPAVTRSGGICMGCLSVDRRGKRTPSEG